jgi:uncharacterized circularly permuted ATP-grasp superfamily protein/uncharacterized alpha-E superfamily protein
MPHRLLHPPADAHAQPRVELRPGYDEATDHTGIPRPHWLKLFDSLAHLGPVELSRRWREARDLIRTNGVTYNVYGDPHGIARPWQLDPIPLVISSAEAATLERGLVQRARLLELLLADVYGPQRLIAAGLLPVELVFPNPGFLRAVHDCPVPGGSYLHLYAANLGRGSDGRWRVIGDRTQAPSGAGYALENRIVMTRTLPEAFKDCRVQRLARFFQSFKDTLRTLAPRNRENPRVVLLTPGPYNETYFEHAYLARYLGYTLAEGGDLTVRDNRVYLKVLGGLQSVDVIFRRLDDDFCDPLELRADSFLGVPGLVNAVRRGTVTVANALGTGVIETPAVLAFLPRLCKELLGEDLLLESAPTWWCGDADARRYVLDHFDQLVIKPTFPASRMDPEFPAELSAEKRADLIARIRHRPRDYVAQSRMDLSSTPVLEGDRLMRRKLVVRSYLAADAGGGFAFMPGGMTRVSATSDAPVVSMQRGGGSKDTWVLTNTTVSEFSLLPAGGARVPITRSGGDLPSRAADNLFWLGRYAERAEGLTRLLRGIVQRVSERPGTADSPELPALFHALALHADRTAGPPAPPEDPFALVLPAVFDPDSRTSLSGVMRSVRHVASVVRDLISLDMWRVVNMLGERDELPARDGPPTPAEVLDVLNRNVITLVAFGGLAAESMTRGEGWRFLDMGRKLERAVHTIHLLKATLVTPVPNEGPVLDAVLEIADSRMTYRRRYLSSLRAEAVLDLVVDDETNPRSLASQLADLLDDVDHLPRAGTGGRSAEQRFALSALSSVRMAEPEKLAAVDGGSRPLLQELLDLVGGWLPILSDAITQQYLSHLLVSRHLATPEAARKGGADTTGDGL